MSTSSKTGLSGQSSNIPSAKDMKFGIVVAEWNEEITQKLYEAAYQALIEQECPEDHIITSYVPGSIELTKGAQILADNTDVDGVICLGCVIQGETKHFDYVCQSVTYGITQLNLTFDIPFIFGVLTTNNIQQAWDRAGGKLGNKGSEAAYTAIRMKALRKSF
jgi:6,7-dimethyl-8-ribityllumazine synthase